MSDSDVAAKQPQPEPPPPTAPDTAARQPPFSSFFSSLTSGFTTPGAGPSQPEAAARDPRAMPVAQPDAGKSDDAAPTRRRQRADAKPPAAKPARQASRSDDKPFPGAQPRSVAVDQAERDQLFQQFLQWRDRQ